MMRNWDWRSGTGRWGLLVLCMVGLVACHKDDDDERPVADRTVLVYMAADNSLNSDGYDNIKQLMEGIGGFSGHLAVYFDARDAEPVLLEIAEENGQAVKRVVKEYQEENSASPEVLSRVVGDTKRLFPADSYGLILWSHGLGWVPAEYTFPRAQYFRQGGATPPRTKYFAEDSHPGEGQSGNCYMDVKELGDALPDEGFAFILFDACLMSGIEVLYELRNKAEYIIASPAEVLAAGFPYERILPYLSGGEEELARVCEEYYQYYNRSSNPYATVAMVRTAELEALAGIVRGVLGGRREEAAALGAEEVWKYPYINAVPLVYYDLNEYIKRMATPEQYDDFREQLDRTVACKRATASFWQALIPADKFSGISSYIPLGKWQRMNEYYFNLEWSKTVY